MKRAASAVQLLPVCWPVVEWSARANGLAHCERLVIPARTRAEALRFLATMVDAPEPRVAYMAAKSRPLEEYHPGRRTATIVKSGRARWYADNVRTGRFARVINKRGATA